MLFKLVSKTLLPALLLTVPFVFSLVLTSPSSFLGHPTASGCPVLGGEAVPEEDTSQHAGTLSPYSDSFLLLSHFLLGPLVVPFDCLPNIANRVDLVVSSNRQPHPLQ